MLLCQGSWVGSNPTGRFEFSVWESLAIRVPRAHEIVGSNPATLTDVMRWVLCWYGKATVNRPDAGSIPAAAAFIVLLTERFGCQSSKLARRVRLPQSTFLTAYSGIG